MGHGGFVAHCEWECGICTHCKVVVQVTIDPALK